MSETKGQIDAAVLHFVESTMVLIQEDIKSSRKEELSKFDDGVFFGRVTALTSLYHGLQANDVDPKNYALPDFDPEHFLFEVVPKKNESK